MGSGWCPLLCDATEEGQGSDIPNPFLPYKYNSTPIHANTYIYIAGASAEAEWQKITRTSTSQYNMIRPDTCTDIQEMRYEYNIMRPDTCTYIQEMSKKDIEDANRENLAKLATKKPEQQ